MGFISGIVIGLFLGALLGLILTSLCIASSRNWDTSDE
jgi:F0F1-type ATP synthase assembly protein I